ncbi:hypothetical protein BUALT_Bualt19G0130700 [Buddleja alternifolia]|uniref:Uncharacterized protein n=1 Tax=Buddleja alternifolia TaxID=168488 RepID=A0AAV6W9C2_9LAMI|nr:hypothetical protein BUALT_Bualt19G0130700 [Buddleja alternifolia]
MCIAVFIWNSHPLYPFLLLLNRDEYHNRYVCIYLCCHHFSLFCPTRALGWWEDGEIVGGRDGEAGGTWLACTRAGKLAFLTNVREIRPSTSLLKSSRGHLPLRFFKVCVCVCVCSFNCCFSLFCPVSQQIRSSTIYYNSCVVDILQSEKSPEEFAEELVGEVDQYNGFNLIAADLRSMSMVYITNRPKDDGLSVAQVSPGIHVLSNAKLDTPWPKAERLRHSFEEVMRKYCEAEISMEDITEKLMNDTTKDDESKLPHIYPPEFEYLLSSIFVEAADTPLGRYGTRSTSGVVLRRSGEISFYERNLEGDSWKEQTRVMTYAFTPTNVNVLNQEMRCKCIAAGNNC